MKAIGSLFGGGSKPKDYAPVALPKVPVVKEIPLADDAGIARAKRTAQVAATQRSGRNSTLLSDQSDKLGGE
jgi:hypothetical protein